MFDRPLTVTGACFLPARTIDGQFVPEGVAFHQMTLDRIEKGEYVLQNTQFSTDSDSGMVLLLIFYFKINKNKNQKSLENQTISSLLRGG